MTRSKGKTYSAPRVSRYKLTDEQIAEYNIASGGTNVRKCNTRECGGGTTTGGTTTRSAGRGLSAPAWLEP